MGEKPLYGQIMIVESDSTLSRALTTFLEEKKYNIKVAKNSEDALEQIAKSLPDLILLAVSIGPPVFQQLRTIVYTSHIPIIFMVANEEDEDCLEEMSLSWDDFLTQKIDMQELSALVQEVGELEGLRNSAYLQPLEKAVDNTLINLGKDQYKQSDFPTGSWIDRQLMRLNDRELWHILYFQIKGLDDLLDIYGFVTAGEVVRHAGLVIFHTIVEFGTEDDFVGFVKKNTFLLITFLDNVTFLLNQMYEAMDQEIFEYEPYYDFERPLEPNFPWSSVYINVGILNKEFNLRKMKISKDGVSYYSSSPSSIDDLPKSWQKLSDLFES